MGNVCSSPHKVRREEGAQAGRRATVSPAWGSQSPRDRVPLANGRVAVQLGLPCTGVIVRGSLAARQCSERRSVPDPHHAELCASAPLKESKKSRPKAARARRIA
jgi:hypothetical protein